MIILHSTDVVKKILHKNNFNSFEIQIKGRVSKCAYNKEKTIIYISPEDNNDSPNSLIVAAHEASHALNYREGVTNNSLLKYLEKSYLSIFIGSVILIFVEFLLALLGVFQISIKLINFLTYFNFFLTPIYYFYYTRDEAKTEKRLIIELQNIWNENDFDVNLQDLKKINKKRLSKDIYLVSIVAVPILMLIPIGLQQGVIKILPILPISSSF